MTKFYLLFFVACSVWWPLLINKMTRPMTIVKVTKNCTTYAFGETLARACKPGTRFKSTNRPQFKYGPKTRTTGLALQSN